MIKCHYCSCERVVELSAEEPGITGAKYAVCRKHFDEVAKALSSSELKTPGRLHITADYIAPGYEELADVILQGQAAVVAAALMEMADRSEL